MIYKITERDVEILRFINEFGFCELKQVMRYVGLKQSNAYKIIKRLCDDGLIFHERIFIHKPGVYRLSRIGAEYTDLPALEKIPITQYQHQLKIIDVFMRLKKLYPEAYFVSERYLLKDRSQKDIFNKKHTSDGLLVFPDNRKISIEVELSMKGKNRIEKIFKGYAGQFDITEVWYFCPPPLCLPLQKLAEKRAFIKIINLAEFLV